MNNEYDRGDGSAPKTYDEMVAAGYEMTGDGFWVPADEKVSVDSVESNIKLLLLESGETLISEVVESIDGQNVLLSDPRIVIIQAARVNDGDEPTTTTTITYSDWMPLARDRSFTLSSKYVVLISTPIDSLVESYTRAREENG